VRFEGLPGEFSQHDFGQVLEFCTGASQRIHFFASRLKYSSRYRILEQPQGEPPRARHRTCPPQSCGDGVADTEYLPQFRDGIRAQLHQRTLQGTAS
jgi:hypothetical protein